MTYNAKTYKKCNFIKLSKDPLKPLKKRPQTKNPLTTNRSRELKEWRDGWFKGQYEKSTKPHESSN